MTTIPPSGAMENDDAPLISPTDFNPAREEDAPLDEPETIFYSSSESEEENDESGKERFAALF